jgi:pimeloyl-ACP methyl ester carboxylesterase
VRTVNIEPPAEIGVCDGLSYALFTPSGAALGGVVILHGAGSQKESHYDFARRLRAHGIAAVSFDQRGHGDSEGALDGRAAADVARIAELLPPGPVALRGSSMGGLLALVSAEAAGAEAVVAICPASAEGMRRGLRAQRFSFRCDEPAFDAFLAEHDEHAAAERLRCPLLLLHAEGDEVVPVELSRSLAARATGARFVEVPGGHHRSIQHDAELQDLSVRFIERTFATAGPAAAG